MRKYIIAVCAFFALVTVASARGPIWDNPQRMAEIRQKIQAAIEPEAEQTPALILRDPFSGEKISFWEFYRYKDTSNWEIEFQSSLKSPFKMSFEEARMEPWVIISGYFPQMRTCPDNSLCHRVVDENGGEIMFMMEPDNVHHGEWELIWRYIDTSAYRLVYDFGYHTTAGVPVTAFQVERWMKRNPFEDTIPLLRDMACEDF